jgi:hypothetical protein
MMRHFIESSNLNDWEINIGKILNGKRMGD